MLDTHCPESSFRPFILVGSLTLIPFSLMSSCSELSTLGFRAPVVFGSLGLACVALRAQSSALALMPLLAPFLAWGYDYFVAEGGDLSPVDADIVLRRNLCGVGAWVIALAYVLLIFLKQQGLGDLRNTGARAGLWLAVLGSSAAGLAACGTNWHSLLTLLRFETMRSGNPWPETKVLTFSSSILAALTGLWMARAVVRRSVSRSG